MGDTPTWGAGFVARSWTERPSLLRRLCGKTGRRRALAVSGTGDGDYFLRQSTAHEVLARMRHGSQSLRSAAHSTISDLDGEGGLIAVDDRGNVALPLNCAGMFRGVLRGLDGRPRVAVFAGDELD